MSPRRWHPIIEGLYRYHFHYPTDGNDTGYNIITAAIRRAIDLRAEPVYADVWTETAVRHTILASHAARQLGLID